ncbi:MAG: S-layer homology domain-containing protein [Cyanophyceae cyanobacterium]
MPDSALPVTLVFETQGLAVEALQRTELTAIARGLNPNDTEAKGFLRAAATCSNGQVNQGQINYWLGRMADSRGNRRKMAVGRDFIDVRCHALSILYHAYRGTQLDLKNSGAIFDVANVARLPGGRLSWNALLCYVDATEAGVLAQNRSQPNDWIRQEMEWVRRWMLSLGATVVDPAPELYIRYTGGMAYPRRPQSGAQMLAGGVGPGEGLGTLSYKFDVRGGISGLGAKAAAKSYGSLKFISMVVPSFNYGIDHALPRSANNVALISPASGFRGVGAAAGRIVEFNCGVGQGVGIGAAIALTQNRALSTVQNRDVQQVLAATGQLPTLYGVGYKESQKFYAFELAMRPDKLDPKEGGGGGAPAIDDITGHWAAPFIEALRSRGTLRGYPDGSFRPDGGLTRAEFAAALVEAFDLPLARSPKPFNDINPSFWANGVITKAVQMGFLSGFPNRMFRPQGGLTRAQTWVALVSGLGLDAGTNLDISTLYGDASAIPAYARTKVTIASDRLLVVNYPDRDRLNPRRSITRGELAATLYQALLTQGQLSPLDHPQIVRTAEILNPPLQDPPALDIIESAPPSQSLFTDLDNHWAQTPIECLALEGILNGLRPGEFSPDGPMTRLGFVQAVVQGFSIPARRAAIKFQDIPETFWANGVVQQAYRAGFIEPINGPDFFPAEFQPTEAIARRDLIIGLATGLNWRIPPGDPPRKILDPLDDGDQVSDAEGEAIAAAVVRGAIANGENPNRLDLDRPATRAEVGAMVYQALVAEGQLSAIPESNHQAVLLPVPDFAIA